MKSFSIIHALARGGVGLLGAGLLAAAPARAGEALRLDPENPHYLLFRGLLMLVITSGEHYGAVLNLDFDYKRYLRTLSREVLSVLRREYMAAQPDERHQQRQPPRGHRPHQRL